MANRISDEAVTGLGGRADELRSVGDWAWRRKAGMIARAHAKPGVVALVSKRCGCLALGLSLGVMLTGCSAGARESYFASRSMRIAPVAGDGTKIAAQRAQFSPTAMATHQRGEEFDGR